MIRIDAMLFPSDSDDHAGNGCRDVAHRPGAGSRREMGKRHSMGGSRRANQFNVPDAGDCATGVSWI